MSSGITEFTSAIAGIRICGNGAGVVGGTSVSSALRARSLET